MALTTFQGPVRSLGGFIGQGPNTVAAVAGTTAAINVAAYAGKIINVTAATTVITLPVVNASANPASSGPGQDPNTLNNLGAVYTFFLPSTATSVAIVTSNGDFLLGQVAIAVSTGGAASMFAANGTSTTTITLNGGTTGGIKGSLITIVAVAAGVYMVSGKLLGTAVLATPFS
jgi:hypothetical protein